jgi:carbonic anhydrase
MDDVMRPGLLPALFLLAALPVSAMAEEKLPEWNYIGGANDDEGWGDLSPAYATCTLGGQQSPVGIDETKSTTMGKMKFDYRESDVITQRRELTLIVQFKAGNVVHHEGSDYALKQIRFHTPAEHSVRGENMPLEMHLIHQNAKGEILIIAVQAKVGDTPNAALQAVIDHLPEKGSPEKKARFNPEGLLPEKRGYYAYTGSLSWPPCTEGVSWRVFKQPITISREQIRAIGKLLGRNARLLQPLYLRPILETID